MVSDAPTMGNRKLREICEIEPRLMSILRRAAYCPQGDWPSYRRLAAEAAQVVGWSAQDDRIATGEALEVAREAIWAALGRGPKWRRVLGRRAA